MVVPLLYMWITSDSRHVWAGVTWLVISMGISLRPSISMCLLSLKKKLTLILKDCCLPEYRNFSATLLCLIMWNTFLIIFICSINDDSVIRMLFLKYILYTTPCTNAFMHACCLPESKDVDHYSYCALLCIFLCVKSKFGGTIPDPDKLPLQFYPSFLWSYNLSYILSHVYRILSGTLIESLKKTPKNWKWKLKSNSRFWNV